MVIKALINKWKKGDSLVDDLRGALNNPRYSDLKLVCEDDVLYGCRALLATRCEMLDRLLYNGMRETNANEILFPTIKCAAMKVILEYIYTDKLAPDSLTLENTVISYAAADYFMITPLQDHILNFIDSKLGMQTTDYAVDLLSKALEAMPDAELVNRLFYLLSKYIACSPLSAIDSKKFTSRSLQALLSLTIHDKTIFFATDEYDVFRYIMIWGALEVSPDLASLLDSNLPRSDHMKDFTEWKQRDNIINDRSFQLFLNKFTDIISPVCQYVDFRRIQAEVLQDVIEPLDIIPKETLLETYRVQARNKGPLSCRRGDPKAVPLPTAVSELATSSTLRWDEQFYWDKFKCGDKLIISANSTLVETNSRCQGHQSVSAKLPIGDNGVYEWDFVIVRTCGVMWIGLCGEGIDFGKFLGTQNAWVVGSNGTKYNPPAFSSQYGVAFGDNTTVTIHLDMNQRTCAFTINGVKYENAFTDLPDKVYPAASLRYPGKVRLQLRESTK
ncbi:5246_t:CDS:2 [Paraglomus occultum]|uniref:5246_t:CDS:1 n=1 Tax=Paraglomus occultum TaxID=144539 RepID=A0A9N8VGN2_9GLOM|nr:5246_t:CDS:2 [Paraglomus occultum]